MYDEENIFAKILRNEIPSTKIYEDDFIYSFYDIFPQAAVHVLVIPKGKYVSFDDFSRNAGNDKVAYFFQKLPYIAELVGVAKGGYRVLSNSGDESGQTVPHFHVHILGGQSLGSKIVSDK